MKITEEWLKKEGACLSGVAWWRSCRETDGRKVVEKLIARRKFGWAAWLIVRLMTKPQRIQYAIYSAELVLENFEKESPGDDRPRQAIEAAKAVLKEPTLENRIAAESAADKARIAACHAAGSAAGSAARSATDSAESAFSAAYDAAESAARSAMDSAAHCAANSEMNIEEYYVMERQAYKVAEAETGMKILAYGLTLLAEG